MEQYILKSALVARIKKLKIDIGNIFNEYDEGFWEGRTTAFDDVICALDTLEVKEIDTHISDSRKANHAKFIKELKQKIDSYERELSKSGDSTKCDDVDWVTLASDMFDTLQKCLLNF